MDSILGRVNMQDYANEEFLRPVEGVAPPVWSQKAEKEPQSPLTELISMRNNLHNE